MKRVTIGILGYGTVGQGVVRVLTDNAAEIKRRCGYEIIIKCVAKRQWQGIDTDELPFICSTDAYAVVNDKDISIVIEVIGGDEPANALIATAIENGKHVITANKALIAKQGSTLFQLARSRGVELAYEAAVAGGIPIIKLLREGVTGNVITRIAGIINGTSNYILTAMSEQKRAFDETLTEAQALGYAEADPSLDINGTDAAHKLAILASIAFGIDLQLDRVWIEGIDTLEPIDIDNAKELGFVIKHLGLAIRRDKGIEIRVHPTLIPKQTLLASVKGVMNAVQVEGNAIGKSLTYGPGAGSLPTASAIIADLIDVIRELDLNSEDRLAEFGFVHCYMREELPVLSASEYVSAYYIRISVHDEIGVLSEITSIFARHQISIESIMQKIELKKGDVLPLIVLTDEVEEQRLNQALADIIALPTVIQPIQRIRVEYLD